MVVGLTGGIGSGKSTVAKLFAELGVPVYDSDSRAKALMVSSPELKADIIGLLGPGAYQGVDLDRAFVASRVFGDPELLQRLNAMVHPAVRADFLQWTAERDAPYVIQENALIFEGNDQDRYDCIILVTAPRELRIQRVIKRDGARRKDVLARMDNQMGEGEKRPGATHIIENLDLATTKTRVHELHRELGALATKF